MEVTKTSMSNASGVGSLLQSLLYKASKLSVQAWRSVLGDARCDLGKPETKKPKSAQLEVHRNQCPTKTPTLTTQSGTSIPSGTSLQQSH